MASNLKDIVECIESEGFETTNWRPGDKRIFRIWREHPNYSSDGMYSIELRAWWAGYLQGLKTKEAEAKG